MFNRLQQRVIDPFKTSIRNKLILTMLMIAVMPVVLVTALAAENSSHSMENQVIGTNLSNMKWTGIYLGDQFARLNNLIYSIQISPGLSDYLNRPEGETPGSQFSAQQKVYNSLNSVYYTGGNHLVGVMLYLHDSQTLFTINSMQTEVEAVSGTPKVYQDILRKNIDFIVEKSKSDPSKFQLIRSINRFENQEKLGFISLEVLWSYFDQTINLLGGGDEHSVFVTDLNGSVLYGGGEGRMLPSEAALALKQTNGAGPGYLKTTHEFVFYNTIDPVGLKLVKIIPLSSINQSALATMNYGLIVGIISAVFSALLAFYFALKTTKPIISLAKAMRKIDLTKENAVPRSQRKDEVGLLEANFNMMAQRIREHINTEYRINLEKKTAELKALQSQINPHFLQNTLQLIGGMIFSQKPEQSYEIIRSLSEMFRYVVRDPNTLATIKSELEHLQHYMKIQQQRFGKRLHYELEVSEHVLNCPIPKLTLQPIVENAFIHGLDDKTGDWYLAVIVKQEPDGVLIMIRDNGAGMQQTQLRRLQLKLHRELEHVWTQGTSIGLINVASRIQMYFGADYKMDIDSEPGKGTCVVLRIPDQKEG